MASTGQIIRPRPRRTSRQSLLAAKRACGGKGVCCTSQFDPAELQEGTAFQLPSRTVGLPVGRYDHLVSGAHPCCPSHGSSKLLHCLAATSPRL